MPSSNDVNRVALSQLQQSTLFRLCDESFVSHALQKAKFVTCRKGDVLFHAGDPAGWVYILLSGCVTTHLHGLEITRHDKPGTISGLTSVFQSQKSATTRSLTHIAASETVTYARLDRLELEELMKHQPFALGVVNYLGNRLRTKNNVIGSLMTNSSTPQSKASSASSDGTALCITVFDTKPYDRVHLSEAFEGEPEIVLNGGKGRVQLRFLEAKLSASSAPLAVGSQAACIFVNDVADRKALQLLRACGVQLLLLRCAGFNNVDLVAAKELDIAVTRVPAYSPHAVAEHAFALLMAVNRRIPISYNRVRDGNFTLKGLEGRDLFGLTCGVMGTGKIGRCFAAIAKGCGMKLLLWDAFPDASYAASIGAEYVPDITTLLSSADVVSLHLPLTPQTHHLINRDSIARLRPGAIIVNTSRGGLVDSQALLEGIVSGKVGGAGMDVYEHEAAFFFEDRSGVPMADSVLARLVNLPNVVVTSHMAFLTTNALKAISSTTRQNFLEYFGKEQRRGKQLSNVVLPPAAKL